MSRRQPAVSGERLIKALRKEAWEVVRQRGSHVRLKKPGRRHALVVPLHRELRRGTLAVQVFPLTDVKAYEPARSAA